MEKKNKHMMMASQHRSDVLAVGEKFRSTLRLNIRYYNYKVQKFSPRFVHKIEIIHHYD
jgi:hypothetical protein